MTASAKEPKWVEAIRNHPQIGRGSCSHVDECYTDEELVTEIRSIGLTTQAQVIKHFRWSHRLFVEHQGETDAQFR